MHRSRLFTLFLSIMVLAIAIPVYLSPIEFLADDAFFYPQVAYNIVKTGVSTFNTITPTNGYHPLWMVVNIVAMLIAHDRRMAGLHVMLGIELGVLLLAIFIYRRWLDLLGFEDSLIGTGLIIGVICSSFWGMESHLAILFVVLSGWQFMRIKGEEDTGGRVLFGLLLGAMILSRLDDVFMALSLIFFAAFSREPKSFIKNLLVSGIPCCLLVVPYLIFNKMTFGHPMPVSGAIKSCFPHISGSLSSIGSLGKACGAGAVLGIVLTYVCKAKERSLRLIRALSIGVLAQLLYTVLFTHDPSTRSFWYYATATLNCALILDFLFHAVLGSITAKQALRAVQIGMGAFALVLVLSGISRSWLKLKGINANPMNAQGIRRDRSGGANSRFDEQLDQWIRTSLPDKARILTVDFPGRIAFFTDADVVPLDGLIGDYKYNDEITKNGISSFIARTNLNYYVGTICDTSSPCPYSYFVTTVAGPDHGEQVEVSSPLYRTPAGSFHLDKDDLLLDINEKFGSTLGHGHLGVWRLRPDEVPEKSGQ